MKKLISSSTKSLFLSLLFCFHCVGCVGTSPGPDKQFEGEATGALSGAGTGAITGFNLGVGAGPGALAGAGIGAVAGGMRGFFQDQFEEQELKTSAELREQRGQAYAQSILEEHYRRRLDLFPSRDIFPADVFFRGDGYSLCRGTDAVAHEIARLNRDRAPWSRLVVASYVRSNGGETHFAKTLAERRAKEIVNRLVRGGIEARRLLARAVIIDAPLVIDPYDHPMRYNQAIEFIPLDK